MSMISKQLISCTDHIKDDERIVETGYEHPRASKHVTALLPFRVFYLHSDIAYCITARTVHGLNG